MTPWPSAVCQANGIDIHYLRTGGAKPPLVLLHGLTGSGACWTPLARALKSDFDIIMPDARGHGESSKPLAGYRYDDHAHDIIELIQALKLNTPFLLGHSMGGLTAALVASQTAVALRGLILADPTFLTPEQQRDVYQSDAVTQHRQLLSLDKAEALSQAQARHPHRTPEIIELVTDARLKTPIQAIEVLIPPNPDYHDLVSAIHTPTLLITADHGVVSLETAQHLQTLTPRLQVEQIQNAGHGLQYDQPEHFAVVVEAFFHATFHTKFHG